MTKLITARGNYIDGRFTELADADGEWTTQNPARGFADVFSVRSSVVQAQDAVVVAARAQPAWASQSQTARNNHLQRLSDAFDAHVDVMADAIVLETGKPRREAVSEAKALGARVTLTLQSALPLVATRRPTGIAGEARAHAQGVLVVLGPYNYPAHLINAHVIPALATGNAVVIKPSENCAYTGEVYASCFEAAGFPHGVFNMVQGAADVGQALVAAPLVDGICFTGAYRTGRAILSACLDAPHKTVALEMGGKNAAVVLADANLRQAAHAILHGAFLTTGQRCTATSRVLVDRPVADALARSLMVATKQLVPGDPNEARTAFGPLMNAGAYQRFLTLRAGAERAGAEVLVPGEDRGEGGFVTPSLHRLPDGATEAAGYLDEELFGPDLCLEVIDGADDAIERLSKSAYGLSNALFTTNEDTFERFFHGTRSGLLNHNRSTNGASGQLPFGGVGKSGNGRPAGIEAVRYTTYPVAVMRQSSADVPTVAQFEHAEIMADEALTPSLTHLAWRHELEGLLERLRIGIDAQSANVVRTSLKDWARYRRGHDRWSGAALVDALDGFGALKKDGALDITVPPATTDTVRFVRAVRGLLSEIENENADLILSRKPSRVMRPTGGALPRSDRYRERLYAGEFVPQEKKTPVVDGIRTTGSFLCSVDESPLCIVDAASQIASLGLGFSPGEFLRALDENELSAALLANAGEQQERAGAAYGDYLKSHLAPSLAHVTYTASGAEANEKAFDLCRQHGPGGRTVIAFEGAFHGRTLISLSATYNPKKRAPFEFEGYRARFVPFPGWSDPRREPVTPDGFVARCHAAGAASADDVALQRMMATHRADVLFHKELLSLQKVKDAVHAGDVCAVIVEPMQGEGGDNYATSRFFKGLRALTRGLGVPLIFDEVQVGFGMSKRFFWHDMFGLETVDGERDAPDVVACAKRAQLGVVLSAWPDTRPERAHTLSIARGLLHARALGAQDLSELEGDITDRALRLALDHSALVQNPRVCGASLSFDLPTPHLAQQVIAQRFYRGYMAYIAGQRTVRFRLHARFDKAARDALFNGLDAALRAIEDHAEERGGAFVASAQSYIAPAWEDPAPVKSPPPIDDADRFTELLALTAGARERYADRHVEATSALRVAKRLEAMSALDLDEDATPSMLVNALSAASSEESYSALTARLGVDPFALVCRHIAARPIVITDEDWPTYGPGVVAIENATYEDGRRETEEEIVEMLRGDGALGLLMVRDTDAGESVVGYCFGGPVERYQADGPRTDKTRGEGITFYSANITLAAEARGAGLGGRLKAEQIRRVGAVTNENGERRYDFITSRNRVGKTLEMGAINRRFGAYVVERFDGNQYGDLSGHAVYVRIPLRRPECAHLALDTHPPTETVNWADGIESPLGLAHPQLIHALARGEFTFSVGTKLTLSNWTTPTMVRYVELLRAVAPLRHTYFTSGRSELVDKGLRCLRVNRPKAQRVIGFSHQYLGTNSAAARSLTDPQGYAAPFGWFDWPLCPHPAHAGTDAAIGAVMAALNENGPDDVLGIVVELAGEHSGLLPPHDFFEELDAIRRDTGVPLIFVETASALGRTSDRLFRSTALGVRPNMVWWFAGGQLGHIFVDDEHYVKKPLTLISTWDGDEVSALRARYHLLEAHSLLPEGRGERFAAALRDAVGERATWGAGLLHAVEVPRGSESAVIARARAVGLALQPGLVGRVVLAPPLCVSDEEVTLGMKLLRDVLSEEGGN